MDSSVLRSAEFIRESSEFHTAQLFVRSQSVVSRCVAGETLIVPVRGKVGDLASIYSFNQTGSLIWQTLESPRSLAELISAVEEEYAVEHEQAERDVTQFLSDMFSAGLVEAFAQVAMSAMQATMQDQPQATGSR
jgi:Coenzyme PQQ synthesis protein D (PqqD)